MIGSLLAGLGCAPEARIGARSSDYTTLVAFAGNDQGNPAEAHVQVIDLRAEPAPSAFAGIPNHTFALYYRDAVEQLRIPTGKIEYAPDGNTTFPNPDLLKRLTDRWEDASELPEEIRAFRFRAFSTEQCANHGGCLLDREDRTCATPCPSPDAPTPPSFERYPALPVLTPCPGGWRERFEDPLTLCEAQPFDGATCGAEELALPNLGCTRIGTLCPTGTASWAEPIPAGASVVFVRAGASGAAGTRADPVGTIERALTLVPSGGVIALGRGQFTADLELTTGVVLFGACATGTEITGNVRVTSTATISNLSLLGRVTAETGAQARFADVIFDGEGAVELDRPSYARLERCWLRGSGGDEVSVRFEGGAHGEIHESVIDDAKVVSNSGEIRIDDCRIAGRGGRISPANGSVLRMERNRIEGPEVAIVVAERATAEVRDLSARTSSEAIEILRGGLRLERAHFDGAANVAVRIESATATISDFVARPTVIILGASILVKGPAARAVIDRAWIQDAGGHGILLENQAAGEIRDLVVRRTRGVADGYGIAVVGSHLKLQRALSEENEGAGLVTMLHHQEDRPRDEDAFLELEDVKLIRNQAVGLRQPPGAHVFGRRLLLADNGGASWYLVPDKGSAEISDLIITGARPNEGACTTLDACRASGVWISQPRDAANPSYQVTRFVIGPPTRGGVTRGMVLSGPFDLEMTNGVIQGHSIGVEILSDAFPLWRLLVRVQIADNDEPIVRSIP